MANDESLELACEPGPGYHIVAESAGNPAVLEREIAAAAARALDALGRYKFMMFGYWAAIWVHLNRIAGSKRPNPFKPLVEAAKAIQREHLC